MFYNYNKDYVKLAQELRKSMTDEEKKLWYNFLRLMPIRALRQKNIGNFIVDFYIPSKKIVIEIDGSQHYEEEGIKSDKDRDSELQKLGIKVLRYTNYQINKQYESVCEDIGKNLGVEAYQLKERKKRTKKY